MRKIFIILTLMVSSFFVFNTNVKADTLSYIIDEKDFAYLNEDFYKVRESSITRSENYNQYYIIIYNNGLKVYFFDKGNFTYTNSSFNGLIFPVINFSITGGSRFGYSSGSLSLMDFPKSINFVLRDTSYSNQFSYINYLDTNIELLTGTTEHTYNLTYNDFTYSFSSEEHFPSLYEFKTLMENPPVEEEPDDEIVRNDSLDSFYILVIEKIQLFANSFIDNDVLLFCLVIFILIFVIELIRRYLL